MPGPDLTLLTQAARAAGEIASHYFCKDPECWDKDDGAGPVTVADLEIDALLTKMLRGARPDYGWLSEETADTDARLTTTRQFVVDPIDGTRAFIEGSKSFATSIAVVEDGVPVAAVVYLPEMDRMFAAEAGQGATLNEEGLAVSKSTTLEGAEVLTAKPNMKPENWINVPPITRMFRSSLAFRLALVGQGRFDGMITLRPSWEWDIAAGDLIVREAGGSVTDRSGARLRFNNPHPQVNGVLAAPPKLHAGLMSHLRPQA